MNSVNLIGRLTTAPQETKTGDNTTVCNFTLAVDDIFSKEDRADFIRIAVFGVQAENCIKFLKKGFLAGVSGRFKSGSYDDKETGEKKYTIDVIASNVQFLQREEKEKSDDSQEKSKGN